MTLFNFSISYLLLVYRLLDIKIISKVESQSDSITLLGNLFIKKFHNSSWNIFPFLVRCETFSSWRPLKNSDLSNSKFESVAAFKFSYLGFVVKCNAALVWYYCHGPLGHTTCSFMKKNAERVKNYFIKGFWRGNDWGIRCVNSFIWLI